VLGLREIAKPKTFDFIVLWFDLGNGQTLHLLLKDIADSISPRHFCLRVADARTARDYFRTKGVGMLETTVIPGADRFFIADPDGNRIEIMQWLEPYDHSVELNRKAVVLGARFADGRLSLLGAFVPFKLQGF
jgi:hypothetical protein